MTNEQILLQAINKVVGLDLTNLKQLDISFDEDNVDELLKVCEEYLISKLDTILPDMIAKEIDMVKQSRFAWKNKTYPVIPSECMDENRVVDLDKTNLRVIGSDGLNLCGESVTVKPLL